MNPQQIALVQQSFKKVIPIAETAAALFYARLFELDPALQSLFKHDLREQGQMLMQTLGFAVKGLSQPEVVLPAVRALGKRHSLYGVKDSDYATVGAALLWTLEQALGDEFTSEVRAAWTEAFSVLANVMKAAAAQDRKEELASRAPLTLHPAAGLI